VFTAFFNRLQRDDREGGFTLIELLVATAMMVVICGAAVTMLISVMQQTPKVTNRADQIGAARNAIERVAREVRQGKKVTSTGPAQMTLETFCTSAVAATECKVEYSCALESGKTTYGCSRTISTVTTKVVGGLASAEVFCFYPNKEKIECPKATATSPGRVVGEAEPARFVNLRVSFPRQSTTEKNDVLEGGAALHNSTSLLTR
jgi:type II secretory pathway pseudopilin PulG